MDENEFRGEYRITHKGGLHARVCARVVNVAQGMPDDLEIFIEGSDGVPVTCKRILGLLTAGHGANAVIPVITRGPYSSEELQEYAEAISESFAF